MKIYVESKYCTTGECTPVYCKGTPGNYKISKRQYDAAARRLRMPTGGYLRLAAVGNNDPVEVLVMKGCEYWAVIR